MGPGSYLLSRDLSSDYHRRADVSLPGSEWIRVGPSGYDHQASKGGCCVPLPFVWCSLCAAVCWRAALGGRLTSAWQGVWGLFSFLLVSESCFPEAFHRGDKEVFRMLVALGSMHCCNYTCALSTWSSSTLLLGELILGGTWRLDAFSAYSFRT